MQDNKIFKKLSEGSLNKVITISKHFNLCWPLSKEMNIALNYYLAQAYNTGVRDALKEVEKNE